MDQCDKSETIKTFENKFYTGQSSLWNIADGDLITIQYDTS